MKMRSNTMRNQYKNFFTFLGIENNAEITIPDFDLPLTIDARLAIYYVKKK